MKDSARKNHHTHINQMELPGVTALQISGKTITVRNRKIPHREILKVLQSGNDSSLSLVETYRKKVLPNKTRTIRLLGRKCSATIIHTLLGYEVQACQKRIHCPDLVTARYLKLFSELGCHSIKLPYDPTVTADLIAGLEASMQRISDGLSKLFPGDRKLQHYVVQRVYAIIRKQLQAARLSNNNSFP